MSTPDNIKGFAEAKTDSTDDSSSKTKDPSSTTKPRKGPISFLSGSLTSLMLAWLSLGLSKRMVVYFAVHPPHVNSQIGQSIATALKTLMTGMCFLATFSFAFIGLGLFLVFLRSLFTGEQPDAA